VTVTVGDPAPPIQVEAYVRGEADPVGMEIGGPSMSWTVLFFYPRDFAFVVPAELRVFAALEADFALEDAALIAASTDSWHAHRMWFESTAGLMEVRYPVIADPMQELARLYGVLDYYEGAALRATFIIDPEGIVRHACVTDPSVGRSPEETLSVLRALRAADPKLPVAA
jgi:alkyl hydroperoxide reductase subunit AhpC